jgi:hypothetical protein
MLHLHLETAGTTCTPGTQVTPVVPDTPGVPRARKLSCGIACSEEELVEHLCLLP